MSPNEFLDRKEKLIDFLNESVLKNDLSEHDKNSLKN